MTHTKERNDIKEVPVKSQTNLRGKSVFHRGPLLKDYPNYRRGSMLGERETPQDYL